MPETAIRPLHFIPRPTQVPLRPKEAFRRVPKQSKHSCFGPQLQIPRGLFFRQRCIRVQRRADAQRKTGLFAPRPKATGRTPAQHHGHHRTACTHRGGKRTRMERPQAFMVRHQHALRVKMHESAAADTRFHAALQRRHSVDIIRQRHASAEADEPACKWLCRLDAKLINHSL